MDGVKKLAALNLVSYTPFHIAKIEGLCIE